MTVPMGTSEVFIPTIRTMTTVATPRIAVTGEDVLPVFEVQQRPHLGIALQDHMASPSAVSAVRSALGGRPIAVHVRAARTALSRAAAELDVVDEILVGHGVGAGPLDVSRGCRWPP